MPKVFKIGITKNKNQGIQETKEINLIAGKGIIGIEIFMNIMMVDMLIFIRMVVSN